MAEGNAYTNLLKLVKDHGYNKDVGILIGVVTSKTPYNVLLPSGLQLDEDDMIIMENALDADVEDRVLVLNEGNDFYVVGRAETAHHRAGDYTIPGETTLLYRIQKDEGPFTVVEVASPTASQGDESEATIALMREVDSESGGAEFMDIYNNGYTDSRQMGIRVQTRGGTLRDFVLDFFDGANRKEALRIKPDRTQIMNGTSGAVFDMQSNGNMVYYAPTGDFYIYLDVGQVFINDLRVKLHRSGTTAQRPTTGKFVGMEYYDTSLNKPVYWNGTAWKDAMGTTV